MKFPRSAAVALLATLSSSSAFTIPSGGRSIVTKSYSSPLTNKAQHVSSSRSGGGMQMFFGNLGKLLGGGGALEAVIDYSNHNHPSPELGPAAQADRVLVTSDRDPNLHLATFAMGCFWGGELAYQRVPGVVYTAVGYTQGREANPNYSQVCADLTGHTEAVTVYYDPAECSYDQLLDTFFTRVDPTTVNGQGSDRGRQYRTGVYFHTEEQEEIARARFEREQIKLNRPIATELKAASPFWPAEKYHQQYLEKGGQSAKKGEHSNIRCYG